MLQDKATKDSMGLKKSLDQCKNQLQQTIEDYQKCKAESLKLDQAQTETIAYLTEDVNVKTKNIRDIENSHKQSMEMLRQSQTRISQLEDNVSSLTDELSSERLSKEELKQEIEGLDHKMCNQQKDIKLYQGQVDTMNDALDGAKNKFKVRFWTVLKKVKKCCLLLHKHICVSSVRRLRGSFNNVTLFF